jgi:FMN phosphatase YigB (HAD superfamily)
LKNARKIFKVAKNAKNVLKRLKKRRIKIIVISDSVNESCYLKIILEKIGLLKYFDIVLTSHDLGAEKPKAFEYFTYLKEKYEVYFLGHDDDEIIGAKKYGFKTIGLKNKNADIFIKNINELLKIF